VFEFRHTSNRGTGDLRTLGGRSRNCGWINRNAASSSLTHDGADPRNSMPPIGRVLISRAGATRSTYWPATHSAPTHWSAPRPLRVRSPIRPAGAGVRGGNSACRLGRDFCRDPRQDIF